jgi:hypothetical protein
MAGYLIEPNEQVPETFNGGFSMYVAAWAGGETIPSGPDTVYAVPWAAPAPLNR